MLRRNKKRSAFAVDRVMMTSSAGLNKEINLILGEVLERATEARLKTKDIPRSERWLEDEFYQIEKSVLLVMGLLKESQRHDCLRVEKMPLSDILTAVIDLYRPKLQKYKIQLEFIEMKEEPKMLLNSVRMFQVFSNLLANAIEAVKNEKEDERRRIEIFYSVGGNVLRVHFYDWGMGVSEEVKEQIFEPLMTTKAGTSSAGLGLPIARQIVRDHGGDILLQGLYEPTHFFVYMPLLNADSEVSPISDVEIEA